MHKAPLIPAEPSTSTAPLALPSQAEPTAEAKSQDDEGVTLAPLDLPAPMLGLAISARTRGDEQKLSDALSKLTAEDPCFAVEHNTVLNETVIRGLGDLHLRMVLEKMREILQQRQQRPKLQDFT